MDSLAKKIVMTEESLRSFSVVSFAMQHFTR